MILLDKNMILFRFYVWYNSNTQTLVGQGPRPAAVSDKISCKTSGKAGPFPYKVGCEKINKTLIFVESDCIFFEFDFGENYTIQKQKNMLK